jgi:hypothetical protein
MKRVRVYDKAIKDHFFDVHVVNLEDAFDRLGFEEIDDS